MIRMVFVDVLMMDVLYYTYYMYISKEKIDQFISVVLSELAKKDIQKL